MAIARHAAKHHREHEEQPKLGKLRRLEDHGPEAQPPLRSIRDRTSGSDPSEQHDRSSIDRDREPTPGPGADAGRRSHRHHAHAHADGLVHRLLSVAEALQVQDSKAAEAHKREHQQRVEAGQPRGSHPPAVEPAHANMLEIGRRPDAQALAPPTQHRG